MPRRIHGRGVHALAGDTTYIDITSENPVVVRVNGEAPPEPPVEPPIEPPPVEPPIDPPPVEPPPETGELFDRWHDHESCILQSRLDSPEEVDRVTTENRGFQGEPYHTIEHGMLALNMFEGEKALPQDKQIRFLLPKPYTSTDTPYLTAVWEVVHDPYYFTGGKQFTWRNNSTQKMIEFNPGWKYEDPDYPYLLAHQIRCYKTEMVGGNGEQNCLSVNEWAKRNAQPMRDAPARANDYIYDRDHCMWAGAESRYNAFLVRPAEWVRYRMTIDWSREPHGLWLWAETDETPMETLLAEYVDGEWRSFRVMWDPMYRALEEFHFEYNNSSTINPCDFTCWHKNLMIFAGVKGDEIV